MTSPPTLKQRIRAAKRALPYSPTMQGTSDPQIQFIVDPVAARHTFTKHELLPAVHDNNDYVDGDGDSSDDDHEPSNCPDPCSYANLYKPTKPTRLLQHALTNANGDAWFRQRHCVSRAFAVPKSMRGDCGRYASEEMMKMIQQSQAKPSRCGFCGVGNRNNGIAKSTLDVRHLAREVASVAMLSIVFGTMYGKQHEMIDALRGMILDTLELVRNHDDKARNKTTRLDTLVRKAIKEIARNNDSGNAQNCLVQRLLEYEKNGEEYYLTRDEVVSNAHSALLAGTQTICTTIAGALAHLAQMPNIQRDLKTGLLSGRDIVMETLRILPPVAGLPRYPKNSGLILSSNKKEGSASNSQCPIKKGQMMIVDLLAFAHAQPTKDSNENVSDFASLKFELRKGRKSKEQPWGIGRRKCPAGVISVECISVLIETLIERNITWKFARPKKDMVDEAACGGWIESIVYCPTLQFNHEIQITFFETIN